MISQGVLGNLGVYLIQPPKMCAGLPGAYCSARPRASAWRRRRSRAPRTCARTDGGERKFRCGGVWLFSAHVELRFLVLEPNSRGLQQENTMPGRFGGINGGGVERVLDGVLE